MRSPRSSKITRNLAPAPEGHEGNWRQLVTDRAGLARLLAEFRPECILHMASLLSMSSSADPPRAWEVNGTAAMALMDLAAEHRVRRFFFPSTSATYGGALPDPLPEDHPQWPDNIYGSTKVAVERVGIYFPLSRGLDFRSVRPCACRLWPRRSRLRPRSAPTLRTYSPPPRAASRSPSRWPRKSRYRIYVHDVTLGILRLVRGTRGAAVTTCLQPARVRRQRFRPGAGGRAAGPRLPVPLRARRSGHPDPRRAALRLYRRQRARRLGWQRRFDLAATAEHLLARATTTST